jgi:hypothetical protein
MSPNPEQVRFQPYLEHASVRGFIHHLPVGDAAFMSIFSEPAARYPAEFRIYLPYRWSDARRIREVARYIAQRELQLWQPSPLDQLKLGLGVIQAQNALLDEIADRLIAPLPWVRDIVANLGTRRRALKEIALKLHIPAESIETVLRARPSPAVDAIHRHIKELTSYPWFLPHELRDVYSPDQW